MKSSTALVLLQIKRLDVRDAAGQARFVESLFGVAA